LLTRRRDLEDRSEPFVRDLCHHLGQPRTLAFLTTT
jgi:hypothetical protein